MKIVVLGHTGMAGHMIKKYLEINTPWEIVGFGRESLELEPQSLNKIGSRLSSLCGFDCDWVINCIGATKPYFDSPGDISIPLYVNSIFPHQLSQWAGLIRNGPKILTLSTDCVYDGMLGRYDERHPHSANDIYGKSKSLGEPSDCMVLRTSIIGPEYDYRGRHFLSWVKSCDGGGATGFTDHLWNGLTTLELSRCIRDIIRDGLYEDGVSHLFSTDISKYEMIKEIARAYDLSIELTSLEKKSAAVDRRLRTVKDLNDVLKPKPFSDMIADLVEWEKRYV